MRPVCEPAAKEQLLSKAVRGTAIARPLFLSRGSGSPTAKSEADLTEARDIMTTTPLVTRKKAMTTGVVMTSPSRKNANSAANDDTAVAAIIYGTRCRVGVRPVACANIVRQECPSAPPGRVISPHSRA